MATAKEMIEYADQRAEVMSATMNKIRILLNAARGLDTFPQSWKSVDVDYTAANVDYQALLIEAEEVLASFPRSPDDVPEPIPE